MNYHDPISLAKDLERFKAQHNRSQRTFGISLTRKCHVACKHCINDSLPNRHSEISRAQVGKLCREIAETKTFDTINMTGGEPFEVFDLLLDATQIIGSHGLRPTVVTSASWAVTESTTHNLLTSLVNAGLCAIIVSRDQFHEPRVPADNVAYALRTANSLNIIAALNLTTGGGTKTRDELLAPIAATLSSADLNRVHIKEAELLLAGRASRLSLRNALSDVYDDPTPLICNVNGPVLLDNGDYAACCGAELPHDSPLRRGHCDETNAEDMTRQVRSDPLVSMIRYVGLQRMTQMLPPETVDPELARFVRSATAADLCSVCLRLLADPKRVAALRRIGSDTAIQREMAVKAALYYGETAGLLKTEFGTPTRNSERCG